MTVEFMRVAITGGEQGTFRAVASGAGSTAMGERGPTRFAATAFVESLERTEKYPLLWQHKDDQPVGVAHLSMTDEGLVLDGKLALEVQRGREAYELLKIGALDGVSIGFTAEKAKPMTHAGKSMRLVEKAKLMEVSLVTFPADPNARVQTIHRVGPGASNEEINDAWWETLADAFQYEIQVGRTFSEANLTKLRSALGTLVELVGKVDPGHISALGRRAARMMKKSIVLMPTKEQKAKASAARRGERLRAVEMQLAGIGDVPLLKPQTPPSYYSPPQPTPVETALQDALYGACQFPPEARRVLTVEAVKQYLVAVGEAEEANEEDASAEDREQIAAEDGGTKTEGAA